MTEKFWRAASVRMIRTAAQTALSMITIGQAFTEINWLSVVSVSLTAAIVSMLTSIVSGLPEADTNSAFNDDEKGDDVCQ